MVPAVVLAAGLSSRMGRLKATLSVDPLDEAGDTFLTRILRTFLAAGVEDTVVVVGHGAESVVESVTRRGLSPRFVLNRGYEAGQLSSVLAGLRAIDRPGVAAMLLTLVDVPLISPATVRRVIERHVETRALVVRPVADESGVKGARHGHPVLIDRRLFPELYAADPATGAKPIVRAHISSEGNVEVTDEGAFLDIDTPQDYERVLGRSPDKTRL
jgi:molybdenum cofactor cytidylyltransferase